MLDDAYAYGRFLRAPETGRPVPIVDVQFGNAEQGLISCIALIDTGSEASILRLDAASGFERLRPIVASGIGGSPAAFVISGIIQIGSLRYRGEFLAADLAFGQHSIIGMDVLQHVILRMDAARGSVALLKPQGIGTKANNRST